MSDKNNENSIEFYSSASSDDQSSVNSVIHVGASVDEGETSEASVLGTSSERQITNKIENFGGTNGDKSVSRSHHSDSSSESDDDNITLKRRDGEESDSSTTTEEGIEM